MVNRPCLRFLGPTTGAIDRVPEAAGYEPRPRSGALRCTNARGQYGRLKLFLVLGGHGQSVFAEQGVPSPVCRSLRPTLSCSGRAEKTPRFPAACSRDLVPSGVRLVARGGPWSPPGKPLPVSLQLRARRSVASTYKGNGGSVTAAAAAIRGPGPRDGRNGIATRRTQTTELF